MTTIDVEVREDPIAQNWTPSQEQPLHPPRPTTQKPKWVPLCGRSSLWDRLNEIPAPHKLLFTPMLLVVILCLEDFIKPTKSPRGEVPAGIRPS